MLPDYLQQRRGEDLTEWKYRLYIAKAKGEIEESGEEIAEILGLSYDNDTVESIAEEFEEIHTRYGTEEDGAPKPLREEEIHEADLKKREAEMEKIKASDQKRENKKILSEHSRHDEIKRFIAEEVQKIAQKKPIKIAPGRKCAGSREAALLLSDWHKGTWQNNGWNVFNESVLRRRIKKLVEDTIDHCKLHKVGEVHVFCLGDMMSGLIHTSTRVMNNEDVVAQFSGVVDLLSQIFTELASRFKKVKVYGVRGNHERMTQKKQDHISRENFFDMVHHFLTERFKDIEGVEVVPNEYDMEIATARICGKKIVAVHGDKDKTPEKAAYNLSMMDGEIADFVFMGHYHKNLEDEVHGCEVVVNPSMCGPDEYARDIRKTSKPAQKLLIFDPEEGRLCTYNINLKIY